MTNRTVVITGGSGKIGHSLVSYFLSKGWTVIATARTKESLIKLSASIENTVNLITLTCDFHEQDAGVLSEKIYSLGLFPDSLVNNARSIEYLEVPNTGRVDRDRFVGEFTVDVVAPYELTMALSDFSGSHLKKVVNIGSQYGVVAANPALYADGVHSPIHYSVAKSALIHLTRELAVRLASKNVQVNCVSYGGVEGRVDDSFTQRYANLTPQRRMLSDSDLAVHVDYLLSADNVAVTGHNLLVDGGWTLW